MTPRKTQDLNITFLGIIPVLKDETGVLNPQEIVSLSGLLTFKGKSIQNLLKESIDKGENLEEKIQKILLRSSLKGHASMATTPVFCFSFEASKFLDSSLTGFTFASALMASGRRTQHDIDDIVFPTTILENARAKEIYAETSRRNMNFFNFLLSKNVNKDETSKILQYGIYGTGILQLSVESIVSLKREYEIEKEWMPEEIGLLLSQIEKKFKEYEVDFLYATRQVAPRDTYPYPNIFKDPQKTNILRDLVRNKKSEDFSEIISAEILPTPGLKERLEELEEDIKKLVKDKRTIKDNWYQTLLKRREIARDYNLAVNVKVLSRVAWRVWSDKKRHRTCPMVVDSIYYSVERAEQVFEKYKAQIKDRETTDEVLKEIEQVFSLPPTVKANPEFLQQWLERVLDSLESYRQLINLGIKEREAIFLIPRGVKIDMLHEYDLFNLISGYYPLRNCSTAEEELRRLGLKEISKIKEVLKKRGLDWLVRHLVVKCHTVGFCLEKEFCPQILSLIADYDEELHKELHEDLERKLQEKMNTT